MRHLRAVFLVLVTLTIMAGCAPHANDEMNKIKPGMTTSQVTNILGTPEHIKRVRFKGHDRDYLVLEYEMVPETPACPSEAVGRVLTGMATLGLSEVGWSYANATPHWVYFLDGQMVYTSEAIDCAQQSCRTWLDITDKDYLKQR